MSAHWPSDDDLPPVDVVVPDDARDLEADVRAYHRELRRRGQIRLDPHTPQRRDSQKPGWAWARHSWALPAGVVLCLGLVAALLSMLGPRPARTNAPSALPVAQEPTAAPGEVGGTLPRTTLTLAGERVPTVDLRPAVLALVPPRCRCAAVLEAVRRQAAPLDVPTYLVQRPLGPASRPPLPHGVTIDGRDGMVAALDGSGVLTATYLDRAPTFVLVHADGVVREVLSGVRPSDPLASHLTPLRGPNIRW